MLLLNAVCIGSVVMLLCKFILEYKLINGYIGIVHDILYIENYGPNNQKALHAYDVVEFKDSSIPNDRKLTEDQHSTFIQIPTVTDICGKTFVQYLQFHLESVKKL